MSEQEIVRAWKDRRYRRGLGEAERSRLPEHPAGAVELADTRLGEAAGGSPTWASVLCCGYTWHYGNCNSFVYTTRCCWEITE